MYRFSVYLEKKTYYNFLRTRKNVCTYHPTMDLISTVVLIRNSNTLKTKAS